jgi:hypothetical protein
MDLDIESMSAPPVNTVQVDTAAAAIPVSPHSLTVALAVPDMLE